jgi:hypothetical protein
LLFFLFENLYLFRLRDKPSKGGSSSISRPDSLLFIVLFVVYGAEMEPLSQPTKEGAARAEKRK